MLLPHLKLNQKEKNMEQIRKKTNNIRRELTKNNKLGLNKNTKIENLHGIKKQKKTFLFVQTNMNIFQKHEKVKTKTKMK